MTRMIKVIDQPCYWTHLTHISLAKQAINAAKKKIHGKQDLSVGPKQYISLGKEKVIFPIPS